MLNQLSRLLSPPEFIIDEQPLPVWDGAAVAVSTEPADASASAAPPATDLLKQLEQMMVEQVRLAEQARILETRKGSDDEFGRFIRQALPFLDNFYRLLELARENPPSDEVTNWLKNVEALYFRIVNLLENYGLVFINSVGKKVDFNLHEVVDVRRSREHPPETVIKELQKGVVFRGRLLRDAKVIVASE